MEVYALTHPGKVRSNNEDACLASPGDGLRPACLVIADGMGGYQAGEVASWLCMCAVAEMLGLEKPPKPEGCPELPEAILESLPKAPDWAEGPGIRVEQLFYWINQLIHQLALKLISCSGMGSTLTLALLCEGRLWLGHVGDSRLYRMREGKLERLTEDHTLVQALLRNGSIQPSEAFHHPQRNVITRAMGTQVFVEPDLRSFELLKGDRLMLCSDGCSDMLEEWRLAELMSVGTARECAESLLRRALEEGGLDNISVVVCDY